MRKRAIPSRPETRRPDPPRRHVLGQGLLRPSGRTRRARPSTTSTCCASNSFTRCRPSRSCPNCRAFPMPSWSGARKSRRTRAPGPSSSPISNGALARSAHKFARARLCRPRRRGLARHGPGQPAQARTTDARQRRADRKERYDDRCDGALPWAKACPKPPSRPGSRSPAMRSSRTKCCASWKPTRSRSKCQPGDRGAGRNHRPRRHDRRRLGPARHCHRRGRCRRRQGQGDQGARRCALDRRRPSLAPIAGPEPTVPRDSKTRRPPKRRWPRPA